MPMDAYLEGSGQSAQELDDEFEDDARRSVKAGFILDKVAIDEELGIESDELNAYITEQAYRMGVAPNQLAQQLTESGQINSVVADVLRSKALTMITEQASVTDETGRTVDVTAAFRGGQDEDGETGEAAGEASGGGDEDESEADS
jgi:trigger factor